MRALVRLLSLALAISVLLPAATRAQEGSDEVSADGRHFRNWAAYCLPDLLCFAETGQLDGNAGDFLFRLTRHRDEPTWNLVLSTIGGRPDFPYDVYATLDGEVFSFNTPAAIGAYDEPASLYLLGAGAQQLMDALGPGSELWFEFLDSSGDMHDPRFSLAGLSAALLWIDEKQGRIDSPRYAGNPPQGLTPVDNFGDDHATVPADLIQHHRQQDDCEPLEDLAHNTLFTVADLGAGSTLYLVPCSGGAYNPSFAVYWAAGASFVRTVFADYSDETSWTASSQLFNADWDAEARSLTSFYKGRGIADCGGIGVWHLRDGYLRLEKFYHKQACDGEGDPGDFPLVYEARELPPH